MHIQAHFAALAQSVLPLVLGITLGVLLAAAVSALGGVGAQRLEAPPSQAMSETAFPS